MTTTIDFIFDFGSPNAYFVHKVLPDIAQRAGVQVNYIPCLLGGIFKSTGNQPPMVAFANVPAKMNYERLEVQRFIARHGLTKFNFNPHFPVNTLMLMRGAVAAELDGTLAAYCDTGFQAMWEDGLKMDDPSVMAEVFDKAGFDGQSILDRTKDPEVKARLVKNTSDAVDRGVFGSPTLFVGDEMFFGKERLGQVEEMINGQS